VPTPRHLSRAPLLEALIDLQLSSPLNLSFAEDLANKTISGLERKNEIRQFSIKLFGPDQPVQDRSEELLGWRYESADGSRVVQLRRNGMTYSILREYTDWNDIKSATHSIWTLFRGWTGKVSLGRVAVRYTNVLNLPFGAELNDYLAAAPQVPRGLPQTLTHFLERIVVPFDHGIFANVTQTLEPALTIPPVTRVILDIDAFSQRPFESDSNELWVFLDHLRAVKNDIFFYSVTDRALEAYE